MGFLIAITLPMLRAVRQTCKAHAGLRSSVGLLERFGCPAVSTLGTLQRRPVLRLVEQRGLEGVVSKRRDAPCPIRRMSGLAQGQDASRA